MTLDGRTVIITGGGRGLGREHALRFAERGANVVVNDNGAGPDGAGDDTAPAREVVGEIVGKGGNAVAHIGSASNWDAASEMVELAVETFGGLDVLVNNAGVLQFGGVRATSLADYERVVRVNQLGTFLGMRAVADAMAAAGSGSIVNVSSIEGLRAAPHVLAYTASKFAVRGMTKCAALELGEQGVRVNSVHPGMIDTRMVRDAAGPEVDLSPLAQKVALRRIGQPEDVADLVVFLGSAESSYCTGAEFVVDGGATATHSLLT